jgi:hypothetical protein
MPQLETEAGMIRVPAGTWKVDPARSSVGQQKPADGGLLVGEAVGILVDVSAIRA